MLSRYLSTDRFQRLHQDHSGATGRITCEGSAVSWRLALTKGNLRREKSKFDIPVSVSKGRVARACGRGSLASLGVASATKGLVQTCGRPLGTSSRSIGRSFVRTV